MPTYQYACTACDHAFEQVQSFQEDSLSECPRCEGRLRKIFNAVGVVFKGSGFYRTDSRADGGSGSSSGSSGSSGSSESSTASDSSTSSSDSSSGSSSGSSSNGGSGSGSTASKAGAA